MIVIPIEPSIPFQRIEVTLSGRQYVLEARWNERASSWYLNLLDLDRTPIALGMRAVLGALLGNKSAESLFPPGYLFVHDTTKTGTEAGLEDFGVRVLLVYATAEEVEDL